MIWSNEDIWQFYLKWNNNNNSKILIDLDICTREIWVLSKYRVISTKIYVWMYTPGAYHLPTSIILINHNASSSYIRMMGKRRISVSNRERVFASSHWGYLLFIVFFLFHKKIEWPDRKREGGRDAVILAILYVDTRRWLEDIFYCMSMKELISFFLLSCCVSSSRIVETIFSGYEKNKMFLTYVWK